MANRLQTVLVSDTHIGHKLGLKSDTALAEEHTSELENNIQEVMWEAWKEFTKKYRNPDCLILLGDICDLLKMSRKENEMWSENSGDLLRESEKLMSMFGKPKRIFAIKGTSAHADAQHVTIEKDLAERLNAHMYRFRRLHKFAVINLAPEGGKPALYHVTHHLSSTTNWYRGTAPAKAIMTLMLNESHFIDRKVWDKIVGILRGHVHHYWYEESDSRRMVINPCWQGQTNWMIEKHPESPPSLGSVILNHYKDGSFDKERFMIPVEKLRQPVFQAEPEGVDSVG